MTHLRNMAARYRTPLALVASAGALAPVGAFAQSTGSSGLATNGFSVLSTIQSYYQSSDILPSIAYWFGVTVLIGAAFYMAKRLIHAI